MMVWSENRSRGGQAHSDRCQHCSSNTITKEVTKRPASGYPVEPSNLLSPAKLLGDKVCTQREKG